MRIGLLGACGLLAACAPLGGPPDVDVSVQRVQAGYGHGEHTYLSMHVLATHGGEAIDCEAADLDVSVTVTLPDGTQRDIPKGDLVVDCAPQGHGDVAVVLDNSGSESGWLSPIQAGVTSMLDGVLDAGGRASMVRVSTNAEVLEPVTDDGAALHDAVNGLFIANGWTALWDGVRVGNETLGGAVIARDDVASFDDLETFCNAHETLGVVAFTDGYDNNSADEQAFDIDAYPGDGIDTTVQDLHDLRVGGVTTPVYTIGLGDDVDHAALQALAHDTGGRHLPVDTPEEAGDVFGVIADYFGATHRVCTEIPEPTCGAVQVDVEWSWSDGNDTASAAETYMVTVDCPAAYQGRSATILLTLSNPGIDPAVAQTLASNAVDWVNPQASASVLVVLDDNHHDEFVADATFVAGVLSQAGYTATWMEEPSDGLTASQLEGYDVVWLSNPGYPPDDLATIEAIQAFAATGGGVVFQGDDMAQAMGQGFSMAPHTHLDFVDNGVTTCGQRTDNNTGASYRVQLSGDHNVIGELVGTSFLYGDDIDNSVPRGEGEQVLAWATLDGSDDCPVVPVITVWDP